MYDRGEPRPFFRLDKAETRDCYPLNACWEHRRYAAQGASSFIHHKTPECEPETKHVRSKQGYSVTELMGVPDGLSALGKLPGFRGLGSSALLVMTIRRHTTQFQPRVGPCCPGSILAKYMQIYANPKSTAKSIGRCGTRMASQLRLNNDAGSKGQFTGGGVPYL